MKRLFFLLTMLQAFMANAQTCPDDNHPHAIDLGLPSGTKWACCNVDTDYPANQSPTNNGGYYAWGETETKTWYDWNGYIHCDGSRATCHDMGSDIAGTEYDVAHVHWGGSWVMPSKEQIEELISNCSFTDTTVNGVDGVLFAGPSGGTVFLPAADIRWDEFLECVLSGGYYWSSTQCQYSDGAYHLRFDSWAGNCAGNDRGHGLTVRPVVCGTEANAMAQYEYFPFVQEGKRWDYEYGEQLILSYTISGDTVIAGRGYKKVYERMGDTEATYLTAVREADRRVYALYPGEQDERLLYDFRLSRYGDECVGSGGWVYRLLYSRTVTTADGKNRRSEHVFPFYPGSDVFSPGTMSWIEGIGTPDYLPFNKSVLSGCKMLGCYLEGDCIASSDNLYYLDEPFWVLPSRKVVCEGRRWYYNYRDAECMEPQLACQWLEGDSTVAGNKYMKLYEVRGDEGAHVRGLLREDSCYIYWYDQEANTERLLMKQGMGQYEQTELCIPAAAQENCRMVLARNIGSADHTYRRQGFETPSGDTSLWVEGIGFEDCGLSFGTDHASYELLSVCDGDECIYGTEIVVPPLPDEIVAPKVSRTASSVLYDLQGRRVQGTPQRGLYIRDGKKVLK